MKCPLASRADFGPPDGAAGDVRRSGRARLLSLSGIRRREKGRSRALAAPTATSRKLSFGGKSAARTLPAGRLFASRPAALAPLADVLDEPVLIPLTYLDDGDADNVAAPARPPVRRGAVGDPRAQRDHT